MLSDRRLKSGITKAVRHFWETRAGQAKKQRDSGRTDQRSRGAVTGGKQMDGFVELVREVITAAGLSDKCIYTASSLELPGYFRPEKKWDLVVVDDDALIAAVEFKSQIGPSFGNNFNSRSEEAIGTAQDIWTAYREGAFSASDRPWLGYVMMLEDCPRSTAEVAVREPHFPVFSEFRGRPTWNAIECCFRNLSENGYMNLRASSCRHERRALKGGIRIPTKVLPSCNSPRHSTERSRHISMPSAAELVEDCELHELVLHSTLGRPSHWLLAGSFRSETGNLFRFGNGVDS